MCVVVVEKEEEENHDGSSPPVVGVVLFQPCPVQLKSIVESGPGAKQSAEEAGPGPGPAPEPAPAPAPAPGYQDPPCLADQGGLVPPMSTHVDPCRPMSTHVDVAKVMCNPPVHAMAF